MFGIRVIVDTMRGLGRRSPGSESAPSATPLHITCSLPLLSSQHHHHHDAAITQKLAAGPRPIYLSTPTLYRAQDSTMVRQRLEKM